MKEALFYKILENRKIQCLLCPHYCIIEPNEAGKCRKRVNKNGKLSAENYGKTVSLQLDPIEKKPLYHFYPGENILSIGANSCNFTCTFCQNYSISQYDANSIDITPEHIYHLCKRNNINMVAYTYTEPFTWYEFVLDSAIFLQQNNIKTVLVTNGFINREPLEKLLPYIDAMNIDLKSMDDKFYREECGGFLKPVLDTIEFSAEKCHLEITNLVITNRNDDIEILRKLVDFVYTINPSIPMHFSKYFPMYQLSEPPTSESALQEIATNAQKKLPYVYLGNMFTDRNTYCPNCGELIIRREMKIENFLIGNKCPTCKLAIYGFFH